VPVRLGVAILVTLALCLTSDPVWAQAGWWSRDWVFDVGLGSGVSRVEPEPPEARTVNGIAMRVGLAKGVSGPFMIGLETDAVLREGGPPDTTGAHSDRFLSTTALTLRLRPLGRSKAGTAYLRAGVGYSSVQRDITRAAQVVDRASDTGFGLLLGADYVLRLGQGLSVGLGVTWSGLFVSGDVADKATFLSTTFLVNWHP